MPPQGLPITIPGSPLKPPHGLLEGMNPSTLSLLQTPEALRQRIKNILKDKAKFLCENQETAKRLLSVPLKFLIEETGVSNTQSGSLSSRILIEEDVSSIFRYLEFPSMLSAKINEIK
jgi:hypothetical protein